MKGKNFLIGGSNVKKMGIKIKNNKQKRKLFIVLLSALIGNKKQSKLLITFGVNNRNPVS